MMENSKRVDYTYPLLILFLTWPLLGGYFFVFARTWIWALVGCFATIVLCPSYFIQNNVKWIAFFLVVLLLNFVTGDAYYNSFPLIFLEVGVLTLSSAIAYYLLSKNHQRATSFVMIETLVIILVIVILTLFLNSIEPGVVRNTVEMTFREGDYVFMYHYYRLGMTNYALPHALPIIIPPLVLGVKCKYYKSWIRPVLLALLILVLYFIYICGAATAVFLSFFLLLMSLWTQIGSVKSNRTWLLVLSLLVLPFILIDDLSLMAIDFFASLTSGEGSVYERMMDIRALVTGSAEGDLEGRISLYQSSFGEFVGSLFLGSNDELGGHSALLDRLATLGLLGFLPYLVFIWLQLKQTYQLIPQNVKVFYLEGILGGFVMLLTKNMSNWELWLMMFVLLPSMVIQFSKYSKRSITVYK